MDPVFYIMAILGCADNGSACSQQRVEPIRYESAAACEAAVPDALMRNTDVSYPVIAAACQQRGGIRSAESVATTDSDA
ncbi:MAG: hypothetical protein CMN73_13655 [Sphingomonas sp.]|nr:hypothetical protein [Sphingomonas sp.]|tara:strand:+ start:897 stop:1133 length:237 start_codon:yes stop_codon:yes gene_type:complete